MSTLSDIIRRIESEAGRKTPADNEDFIVDAYAGGNIDDAFSLGVDAGRIELARELLKLVDA